MWFTTSKQQPSRQRCSVQNVNLGYDEGLFQKDLKMKTGTTLGVCWNWD